MACGALLPLQGPETKPALADFNTAVQLKPDDPINYSRRVQHAGRLGQLDLALDLRLRKAVQLRPTFAEALLQSRHRSYAKKGQNDLAIATPARRSS